MDLGSRQSSTESNLFSRPASPIAPGSKKTLRHQSKSFDFEMVCDENTPNPSGDGKDCFDQKQPCANRVAASMVQNIMDDVFGVLQMKEVKEKLLKGQHLTFRKRDEPKPVIVTKPPVACSVRDSFSALLEKSVPRFGTPVDETKGGVLPVSSARVTLQTENDSEVRGPQSVTQLTILNNLLMNSSKRSAPGGEKEQATENTENGHRKLTNSASVPAKLSSPSPDRGNMEKTPENSANSQPKFPPTNSVPAKTHSALGLTLSLPVPNSTSDPTLPVPTPGSATVGLRPPSLHNAFEKERMPPRRPNASTTSDEVQMELFQSGLKKNLLDNAAGNVTRGMSCDDSLLAGKMRLTQTLSDPSRVRRKKLGLERSNTTPSSPTGVALSNSLAEQCAVIMDGDDSSTRSSMLQSSSLQKRRFFDSQVSLDKRGTLDPDSSQDQGLPEYGSHQEEEPMMWRTRKLEHRLSSSLPTLSRNWTAFEIDPEDDSLTIEEMEALSVAAQRQPKRMTLPTSNLSNAFHTFNEMGSQDYNDADMLAIPYCSAKPCQNLTPSPSGVISLCTPSPPSPNVSPSESRLSSRRGSLKRQDMRCLTKVSEEDSMEVQPREESNRDRNNDMTAAAACGGDPWHMTNTPEFISRRESLEIENRKFSPRTLYVKVPIAKMDRWTQVISREIKSETGWNKPVTSVQPRRRMVRKQAIEAFSSEDSQEQARNANNQSTGVPRIVCDADRNTELSHSGTIAVGIGDANDSLLHPARVGDTLQPVRQSTVDTIDSGIVDSPKDALISPPVRVFRRPKPRFISGHRMVTRSRYRGKITLDPKLVSGSPNASLEEDVLRSPKFHQATMSAGLRFSRSISETRRQKRRAFCRGDSFNDKGGKQQHRSPKFRSMRRFRRVKFSRKVMLYRRSSSRSSRSSLSVSYDTPTPTTAPSVPAFGTCLQSAQTPAVPAGAEAADREAEPPEWTVGVAPEVRIHLKNSREKLADGGLQSTDVAYPNKNPFFSEFFAHLDAIQSYNKSGWKDDEEYDELTDRPMSVDKISTVDRGYDFMADMPAMDTVSAHDNCSGSETSSEIVRLTSESHVQSHLNLPEDLRLRRPSISIEDEVFIPMASLMSQSAGCSDDGMELPSSPSDSLVSDTAVALSSYLPDPFRCRAFGAGLNMGKVGVKNNFQVRSMRSL